MFGTTTETIGSARERHSSGLTTVAISCKPEPVGSSAKAYRVPPRTAGPLGYMDHGDPNITSFFGDSPGPLGLHDCGQVVIGPVSATATARRYLCHVSGNEVLAPAATAVPTALTYEDSKAVFKRWEAPVTVDSVGSHARFSIRQETLARGP